MKAIDIARADDASAETPPAERPSRADALVRVAEAFVAGDMQGGRPGGERHQLVVCVEANELMPEGVSAEMDGTGMQALPETLKRLACDASLCTAHLDAEGEPLGVGRKTRTIPGAIRRALHARDRGCRFPGCGNRRWLDAHHIEHWVDGGETSVANLVLVCPAHHRLVHEGGYSMRRDAAGTLSFHRPDGSVVEPVPGPPEPRLELPLVERRRATYSERPDYNAAVGVIVPLRPDVI